MEVNTKDVEVDTKDMEVDTEDMIHTICMCIYRKDSQDLDLLSRGYCLKALIDVLTFWLPLRSITVKVGIIKQSLVYPNLGCPSHHSIGENITIGENYYFWKCPRYLPTHIYITLYYIYYI